MTQNPNPDHPQDGQPSQPTHGGQQSQHPAPGGQPYGQPPQYGGTYPGGSQPRDTNQAPYGQQGFDQAQYAEWYNPNAGPGAGLRNFDKRHLLTKPVYWLLLLSAFMYLSNVVMQQVGQFTSAYQSNAVPFYENLNGAAAYAGYVIGQAITIAAILGLYVLVLVPTAKGKNWGRVVGFVFAGIGSLIALGNLVGVSLYGAFGIVIVLILVIWVAANIGWIVVAALTWQKSSPPSSHPYRFN